MPEVDTSNMSAEEIAELQKQNCVFCKIASKQIPAKILHEDERVICVLDINPASEGHILIFPKEHYMIMPHIPNDLLEHLFKTAQLMSKTLLKTLHSEGTSMFIANGMAAGQKAPHVLIHVFPRKTNDNLLELPTYEMNNEQKDKLKSSLKPYLNQIFGKGISHDTEKTEKSKDVKEDKNDDNNDVVPEKKDKYIHQKKHEEEKSFKKKESKRSSLPKDQSKDVSKNQAKDQSTDNKKVNLDDIAKLFGG